MSSKSARPPGQDSPAAAGVGPPEAGAERGTGLPPVLSAYSVCETLRDGTTVVIRAIRPDDKTRLSRGFERLSAQTVYFRFLAAKKRLSDEELVHLTELDFVRHVGLAATIGEGEEERFIGVGRYVASVEGGERPERAEVAFVVADDWQGKGIGRLLLRHLMGIARAADILEFEAEVLGRNRRMLKVFASEGREVNVSVESGMIRVLFSTAAVPGR